MQTWEVERRKVWGLLLELKQKIKILEKENVQRKEKPEVTGSAGRSEAEGLYREKPGR